MFRSRHGSWVWGGVMVGATTYASILGCSAGTTGLLAGSGIGALAGQAIGRDTESTLIGTAVGAGLGYVIGNEIDKQQAQQQAYAPPPAPPPSYNNSAPPPSYNTAPPPSYNSPPPAYGPQSSAGQYYQPPIHDEVGPLGGTRWITVNMEPPHLMNEFASKIVEFQPTGTVITTTTYHDGAVKTDYEGYRVVGSTLIINKPGYLVNTHYHMAGPEMIMEAQEFRAVMRRLN